MDFMYTVYLLYILMLKETFALQRYYMEDDCGGTIAMEDVKIPAGRLSVTRRSKYRSHFSCHVTIIAPEGQRLVIVFREMDIELESRCDDDFVQFFDGLSRSSHIVSGLKPRLCGHMTPIGNYVTSGNALTVYFQSDVYRQQNGFEIVFTAFHTGKQCRHDEFRCSNGRCIAKSLECDDYNNCGDSSDECKVDSEVLVAVIFSVFLLTIIATGVFLLIRRKRKISELRKVKKAFAEALRFHIGVGDVLYNKHDVSYTCNKAHVPQVFRKEPIQQELQQSVKTDFGRVGYQNLEFSRISNQNADFGRVNYQNEDFGGVSDQTGDISRVPNKNGELSMPSIQKGSLEQRGLQDKRSEIITARGLMEFEKFIEPNILRDKTRRTM